MISPGDVWRWTEQLYRAAHDPDEPRVVVIQTEIIALDTCHQLVRQGKSFSVSKVAGGWRFEVKP